MFVHYKAYRVAFSFALCLFLIVFLRYVLVCAAVVALIAVLCLTYEKSAENTVDPKGRGVLITGCDTGNEFHLKINAFVLFL